MGALLGEPGVVKEGTGDGHLFPLGPRWETWERTHARGLCMEEASGSGVSQYSGSIGGHGEGGPSAGNFEKWMKGSLGMGHLSLKRLTAEGREGGLLYWVTWVMKRSLWGQASLFMGAQLGNLEWARLLETLRDG